MLVTVEPDADASVLIRSAWSLHDPTIINRSDRRMREEGGMEHPLVHDHVVLDGDSRDSDVRAD